jgi:hypothetical protein
MELLIPKKAIFGKATVTALLIINNLQITKLCSSGDHESKKKMNSFVKKKIFDTSSKFLATRGI